MEPPDPWERGSGGSMGGVFVANVPAQKSRMMSKPMVNWLLRVLSL